MDLQEMGCGGMDWIDLDRGRDRWQAIVNGAVNLQVPYNAGNFLTSREQVRFSRMTLLHGVSKYEYYCAFMSLAESNFNPLQHDTVA
jgi:hypothetical protein